MFDRLSREVQGRIVRSTWREQPGRAFIVTAPTTLVSKEWSTLANYKDMWCNGDKASFRNCKKRFHPSVWKFDAKKDCFRCPDWKIEAKVDVCDKDRARQMLKEINDANEQFDDYRSVSVEENAEFDEEGYLYSLKLEFTKIRILPENFGRRLTVGGNLDLSINKLQRLPENFGRGLTIGGNLDLRNNPDLQSVSDAVMQKFNVYLD